jgi:death on curing protein
MPRRRLLTHLDVEAVLAIHEEVLATHGGGAGLRDRALLESAIAAPQATYGGRQLIGNPFEVAAAYLFYLCRNHPFVDGDKRAALAASLVFLHANGVLSREKLPADIDQWESLVMDVAASRIDREETTRRFMSLLSER